LPSLSAIKRDQARERRWQRYTPASAPHASGNALVSPALPAKPRAACGQRLRAFRRVSLLTAFLRAQERAEPSLFPDSDTRCAARW
jgi:hypothetical protein